MAAWLPCQSKWLYLQRIFKEDKYQKKLPGDFQVYQAISDTYTTFIHQVSDNPNVLHVVSCKDESSDFKGMGNRAGVRMRSGMRMRTHRMREILLNADKDAIVFDEIWEWMRTRILTKAFASLRFS